MGTIGKHGGIVIMLIKAISKPCTCKHVVVVKCTFCSCTCTMYMYIKSYGYAMCMYSCTYTCIHTIIIKCVYGSCI